MGEEHEDFGAKGKGISCPKIEGFNTKLIIWVRERNEVLDQRKGRVVEPLDRGYV